MGYTANRALGEFSRHNEINENVKRALVTAGYQALREPVGLSSNSALRPDGITQIPWSNGKGLIWHVTVWDKLASTYVNQSSKEAGQVASLATKLPSTVFCLIVLFLCLLRLRRMVFGVERPYIFSTHWGKNLFFSRENPVPCLFFVKKSVSRYSEVMLFQFWARFPFPMARIRSFTFAKLFCPDSKWPLLSKKICNWLYFGDLVV